MASGLTRQRGRVGRCNVEDEDLGWQDVESISPAQWNKIQDSKKAEVVVGRETDLKP